MGSVSYPASFPSVIGVDSSPRCLKNDDFVFVTENGIVNLRAKGGNQRIAWVGNTYIITQGSSYAAAYITAYCIKLLQNNICPHSILKEFKEHAIYKYPEIEISGKENRLNSFRIKKAIVFPFNKEVTSILRFSDLLDFELLDIYDTKRSGNVGRKIQGFNNDLCYIVKNIDLCTWESFDTLIIGHTHDLEYYSNEEIRSALLALCLKNKINVFSFDDEKIDADMINSFISSGLKIYYPAISSEHLPLKMGKMFVIKTPVLGIFGTSSQQGKFTLQLQLRKHFLREGYAIGQLGSEPESLLFNMDYVYPFGFRSNISIDDYTAIEYLNYCISEIDKKQNDLIIAGSQSGTLPMLYNHITNFTISQIVFLLGIRPDAVILCVNYHDRLEDIRRTVTGIESLAKCKVIACSLFPFGFKDDWDLIRGIKSKIDLVGLDKFANRISESLSIPCFVLDEMNGPSSVYHEVINFFKKKT
jgi:uncharacterized NAD-dependent epimerase/dehydratase family protein